MLEEAMRYVNNRFDRDAQGNWVGSRSGAFSIADGSLEIVGVPEGQYYWVEGSALNDGLHRMGDSDMDDEDFEGRVVLLRVPKAFSELCAEIAAWNEANASVLDSPLQSESFGGYSYSKASGGAQGNETPAAGWQLHFGARLRPFRKLSRDWV